MKMLNVSKVVWKQASFTMSVETNFVKYFEKVILKEVL